ncbi:MAG: Crp/Fnr family transcriptional regulator [Mucilaginibacter sp.]|nr:Crp/Fnr family transcriptional regulator [Mucilaginibacter sp.]
MIEQAGVVKKLRKHQYLLQEGDVWRYNAFVCEGCLKTYRVDDKGVEHILYFSFANRWAGDRESLLSGKPSKSNIDAIEDSTVLLFNIENFETIKKQIPAFKDLATTLLERSFIASQNRIHAAISQTAEERYFEFLKNSPQIANRVPQHMIASYLGISPETLSRVRKTASKSNFH